MNIYTLEQKQFLPLSLAEAWKFFSDPHNLKEITSPSMDFRVISETGHETYAGQIIQYTVKPMFGIPVRWVTEITHVRELVVKHQLDRIFDYRRRILKQRFPRK